MVSWFAQSDDGDGWIAVVNGVKVVDFFERNDVAKKIQQSVNIGDEPYSIQRHGELLGGYVITDLPNSQGRYKRAAFCASSNMSEAVLVESVLKGFEELGILISPQRLKKFTSALKKEVDSSCKWGRWVAFGAIIIVVTLIGVILKYRG